VNKVHPTALSFGLAVVVLLATMPAIGQWSAEPGTIVRNAFGPQAGNNANQCRGACGAGCPESCAETVAYECLDSAQLRRVVTYECGTHQGCRVHDDCLDACLQSGASGGNCQAECDAKVMQRFGFESAAALGIDKAHPGVPDSAFMVKRLSAYDPRIRGTLVYPASYYEAGVIAPDPRVDPRRNDLPTI